MNGLLLATLAVFAVACSEDDGEPIAPIGTTVLKVSVDGDLIDFPATSVTSFYDDAANKVRISGIEPSDDPLDEPDKVLIISFAQDPSSLNFPYTMTTSDSLLITYRHITQNDTVTWLCDNPTDCNLVLTEGDESKIKGTFSGTLQQTEGAGTMTLSEGSFAVGLN